jgi:hypothetical protein
MKKFARPFVLASTLVLAFQVTSGGIQPVQSGKVPSVSVLQEGPGNGGCYPMPTCAIQPDGESEIAR